MLNTKTNEIPITQVICEPDKYPRKKANQMAISMLQSALEGGRIPPIEINQNNYLIDGFHRLQAHKIEGLNTIKVVVTQCEDKDILWLSTQRNSIHGQQLSREDKKELAKTFFRQGYDIPVMQDVLAVGKSQLYDWLKDEIAKKDDSEKAEILEYYLRCLTEQEIAEKLSTPQQTVNRIITQISENGIMSNPPESVQDYNLWEFNVADDGAGEDGFPGRMPGQVIENLLWYFTDPFDLVLDPMAGGGTTLDVCLSMHRRCLCYDINPIRPHEIKQHDITSGLPTIPQLRKNGTLLKPRIILLDPPYWKQKKGEYSSEPSNLANLGIDQFHITLTDLINQCHEYVAENGYIAVIISPTRSNGVVFDHMAEILNRLDLSKWLIQERVIVSYTTQQALAYHVTQAREGKYMLRRYRDLLILRPG